MSDSDPLTVRPSRRRRQLCVGLIYGLLNGLGPQAAVEYGAAHGALAMTTPADTSMATKAEVERLIGGAGARVVR